MDDILSPDIFSLITGPVSTVVVLIIFAWLSIKGQKQQKDRDEKTIEALSAKLDAVEVRYTEWIERMEEWQKTTMFEAIVNNTKVMDSFNQHMSKLSGFVQRGEHPFHGDEVSE